MSDSADEVDSVPETECKIVKSNRGGLKLICDGFAYYKDKSVTNIFFVVNFELIN